MATTDSADLVGIGPEAKSALSALEQVATTRGVGPAAQEAILQIQGKPVPTWW